MMYIPQGKGKLLDWNALLQLRVKCFTIAIGYQLVSRLKRQSNSIFFYRLPNSLTANRIVDFNGKRLKTKYNKLLVIYMLLILIHQRQKHRKHFLVDFFYNHWISLFLSLNHWFFIGPENRSIFRFDYCVPSAKM